MFFLGTPVRRPEQVIPALAEGRRHWREGYSAYELAYAWIESGGIPQRVRAVLDQAPEYRDARLVEAFFEKETELRSRGRPSQTDLLALLSVPDGHAVLAVEGKVAEPFGPLVREWRDGGAGKEKRLQVLCETLGLQIEEVGDLRYQLLHRAAAAIYEAQRYGTGRAMLLVHSFSAAHQWFDDFAAFAARLGTTVPSVGVPTLPVPLEGAALRLAWAADEPRGAAAVNYGAPATA